MKRYIILRYDGVFWNIASEPDIYPGPHDSLKDANNEIFAHADDMAHEHTDNREKWLVVRSEVLDQYQAVECEWPA